MLTIGCHLSISRGYAAMGRTALQIGANTFAFFTRNPRGGTAKVPDPDDVAELRRIAREHAFGPLVAHAPYTYNLCSAKECAREFALEGMREDRKYPHRKWICPHRPSTKQIPGKHQRKHCIRCKYLYQYLQPCSILLLYNRSHYSINHSQNQPQNVNGRWQRQTKSGRSH